VGRLLIIVILVALAQSLAMWILVHFGLIVLVVASGLVWSWWKKRQRA
jgi:hypothetical protein